MPPKRIFINMSDEFADIPWKPYVAYRCDKFTNIHRSNHILFSGCSFTAGEGLEKEDTWAYKTHQYIADNYGSDGYYNVGFAAAAGSDAIDQIFKYINKYGVPKVVFLLLPDVGREHNYIFSFDSPGFARSTSGNNLKELHLYRSYFYLNTFLKSIGSELYAFTWINDINGFGDHLLPPKDKKIKFEHGADRPLWREQINEAGSPARILKDFDSFYEMDTETITREVYRYHTTKNKKDPLSLFAADEGAHPGKSFHDYYAQFILEKFEAKTRLKKLA